MSLLHVATNAEHVSLNRAYMHVAAMVPEHIVKLFIIFHEEFLSASFFACTNISIFVVVHIIASLQKRFSWMKNCDN